MQANAPGSLSDLPPRAWLLTGLTGIAAGLGAIVMMAILRTVQHLAFSYHAGEYSAAAARHGDLRRMTVLVCGGIIAGFGGWILRRKLGGSGGEPTRAVWSGSGELSLHRTLASGALSEVVIGLGASLGREAAPQHAGAAFGAWLSQRFSLPPEQRLVLIACGAGAGVGAVYNVPLAGALFAAELYLGSISLATVVPALLTSAVATCVGWLALPDHAVYSVPTLGSPSPYLLVWAVIAGVVIGVIAAGYVRLIGWASDHQPTGRRLLIEPPIAFAVLGLVSLAYPLLLGNGRDLAQFAFAGGGGLLTLAALAALKPLVTSLCLRSGASGGLFTPTLSLGAVLGALLGHVWALWLPGASAPACAVVGAAAMLAAGMQAPVAAVAFTLELTGTVNASLPAILLAVGAAALAVQQIESRSIYSVRLPTAEQPTAAHRSSRPPAHAVPVGGHSPGRRETRSPSDEPALPARSVDLSGFQRR